MRCDPQRQLAISALFLLLLGVSYPSTILAQNVQGLDIRIISTPPRGEGPQQMEPLRARVTDPEGKCGVKFVDCRVALFSFVGGQWFAQPFLNHQLVEIGPDGLVDEDIHLGTRYAALVVFPNRYADQANQISRLPTQFSLAKDEARAGTRSSSEASQAPARTPENNFEPSNPSRSVSNTTSDAFPTPSPSLGEDSVSNWLWPAVFGLLLLSLLLNLTGKVEPFAKGFESFFKELISVPYSVLRWLRQASARKLAEEVPCKPSKAIAGIFFFAIVVGAAVANFGVVKFSLETFLPDTDFLPVLVLIFVCLKAGAGWLCHIAAQHVRNNKTAVLALVVVFAFFVLSCVFDASITYKRVALIEAVNSGAPLTSDVPIGFSENAMLMSGLTLLMSCLEFVFACAAFHLASKPIAWLFFSPVLLPAFVLELILGVIHRSNVAGVLATLLHAILVAPKVIVLRAIDLARRLLRSTKESAKQAVASAITRFRQRKLRKAQSAGEAERMHHQQTDETAAVIHALKMNNVKRAAALQQQQDELQFEGQELVATLSKRGEVNSFLRDTAFTVATQNIEKMAEVFPRTFASFVDKAEVQAETAREFELERAAEAMTMAAVKPIITMSNAQSSIDGHYPQMKYDFKEARGSVQKVTSAMD